MQRVKQWADQVRDSIGRVIYGKDDVVDSLLISLLCGGHVLLEDVPGVGKTILARAMSLSLGGTLQRIQCTPDLLPSDVLGVSIYNRETGEFEFRQGPVVTNLLLVDEINRATPRTQSALLEAMERGTISVDGKSIRLPQPFFLLATENPVEFEGTFPLPEAQRDRFFLATRMGYPAFDSEKEIMESQKRLSHPVNDLSPVTTPEEIMELRALIPDVAIAQDVRRFILSIVEATRRDTRLKSGASPRASKALYRGAQARAALAGRAEADVTDVAAIAVQVLWKRISVSSANLLKGLTEIRAITDILEQVKQTEVPVQAE